MSSILEYLLCFSTFTLSFFGSQASSEEFRLLQYLKENYDHFERPVENNSVPLDVKVRFILSQILDVDERNQVVTLLAYIDYHWKDYKLSWDPARFGGINNIRFSGASDAAHKIWRPDVLLFNSVSSSFDSTYSSQFIVNNNGEVQQNPPGIFRFSCSIDITFFPFDDQTCFLKFGSWTYSGNYIKLDMLLTGLVGVKGNTVNSIPERNKQQPDSYYVNESIDLQVYITNGEWDLLNTPGKRVVTEFDNNIYHELFYYIRIRRRTLAYGINLIIPSLIISVMTVLGFTLPPNACEKVTLETTILLSVVFFLQMVSNMSPPQSKAVPILAAFFSCCLLVVSCSCVFTVLILAMQHRKPETHKMGQFMRRLLLDWLPYILLMQRPKHPRTPKYNEAEKDDSAETRKSLNIPLLALPRPSVTQTTLLHTMGICDDNENFHQCAQSSSIYYLNRFVLELRSINDDVEKLKGKMDDDNENEALILEWQFAALVVDRLCLYMFSSFISVSTCGLIVPHIIEGMKEE